MHKPKLILVVMDGWGYSPIKKGNAIYAASTPTFDYLWNNYAHTLLKSFGENVGLPWGSIGSSEVGHTSIGCGRLVNQEISMIDREIDTKEFYSNKILVEFIEKAKAKQKPFHIIGLVSRGGVHSHIEHLLAILEMLKKKDFDKEIFIHAITDGRDTSPKSASQYLGEVTKQIRKLKINAKIADLCGRYYAMDRDNRWDRTRKAYLAYTKNIGSSASSVDEAITLNYKEGLSDEFIKPTIIDTNGNNSFFGKLFGKDSNKQTNISGNITNGSSVLFFNTRPDRMRQIVETFLFKKSQSKTEPVANVDILTLSTYDKFLPVKVAYPSREISDPLAKILSDHKIHQGHFAETEKYAHITYFFNGGNPTPYPLESWNLVPSPKVKTYDEKPEMSASKITDSVFRVVEKEKLDFVLINYANTDMVGHTGKYEKVITAVETIDAQLKRLMKYLPETTLFITADHGNAECMIHPETGEIDKKHTVNPVPFILVNPDFKVEVNPNEVPSSNGILADICPTVLALFGIDKLPSMNGLNLLESLKPHKK